MDKLIRRTTVTFFLLVAVYFVIFHFPIWAFAAFIALFAGLAQVEFFKMVEHRNIFVYSHFGVMAGSLLPFAVILGHNYPVLRSLEPVILLIAGLVIITLQFTRKSGSRDRLVSMSVTLFSILYICWLFAYFVKLRVLDNGANYVAFLVIVTKGADIGAYLGGSKFGKNALIPRISPNKTREGTILGVVMSMVFALILGRFLTGFAAIHNIILGAVMGVLGQTGDLAESLIKRDCDVKDSGGKLADIGGFFDLIDSLLFTAPVFFYYLMFTQ